MTGSNRQLQWKQAAGLALLAGLSSGAFADYQETLAARGADAFTPPSTLITIESQDIDRAFSADSLQANPALSDQEVMVDLHARMNAEDHLERAAMNLAPAESNAALQTDDSEDDQPKAQAANTTNTEPAAKIAAR